MQNNIRITSLDILPVRVSRRTLWVFIQLKTNDHYVGVGECSVGVGARVEEIKRFFALINDTQPNPDLFIRKGRALVKNIFDATAFSGIEMALWDLKGKLQGAPVFDLLGDLQNERIPIYANINRRTMPREPDDFAKSAAEAVSSGFDSVKAAPFDGLSAIDGFNERQYAIEKGVNSLLAIRKAVGGEVKVKVDCHENFNRETAIHVARQLQPVALDWYEEPTSVTDIDSMLALKETIVQPLAGGELGFGVAGFKPLLESHCVDIIMPDVMHCGGIKEFVLIAQEASSSGMSISAHNACGPVSTAASIQAAALVSNCESVELQWGEVEWRNDLIIPSEEFQDSVAIVPRSPGLGIELNDLEISSRLDS